MKTLVRLATLALLMDVTVGCCTAWASVRGNGHETTEKRSVPSFRRIALEGSLNAEIREGSDCSVAITIDENLQSIITTRVSGDTLIIGSEHESYSTNLKGRATITLPRLAALDIDGSGNASISGLSSPAADLDIEIRGSGNVRYKGSASTLRVKVAGSGDVRLEGQAQRLVATIDGSGDIDARGLPTRDADLRIAGSGNIDAELRGGEARFSVDGSGDIRWAGDAQVRAQNVSGSGSVHKRG